MIQCSRARAGLRRAPCAGVGLLILLAGALAAHAQPRMEVPEEPPGPVGDVGPGPSSDDDVGGRLIPTVMSTGEEVPPELARRGVIEIGVIRVPETLFSEPSVEPVVLRLAEDTLVLLLEEGRQPSQGVDIVFGRDQVRANSYFAFVFRDHRLVGGDVRYPGRAYSFRRPERDGSHIRLEVLTIDPRLIEDERPPITTPRRNPSSAERGEPVALMAGGERNEDGDYLVDVLVAYTPKAGAAMQAEWATDTVEEAVDIHTGYAAYTVNLSFAKNGIDARFVLAGRLAIDYDESTGSFEDHVKRLWCACDHELPANQNLNGIFTEWKASGADIVSLWIEPGTADTGIAELMDEVSSDFAMRAVNVISWWAAGFPNYSLAHELGHNMAARHDRFHDPTDGKPFDYNHGFWNLDDSVVTLMTYRATCEYFGLVCDRVPVWSDAELEPAGSWGVPVGDAWASHNRKTLEMTLAVISELEDHTKDLVGCCVRRGFTRLPGPCE